MLFKRRLLEVLRCMSFVLFGLATAFGLNTFYYSRRRKSFVDSANLSRYCKFMGLAFFVLYPLSLMKLLPDFDTTSGITDLVRNSVFVGNWLLCTLIFVNQTSHSTASCNIYNRAGALLVGIMKNRSERTHSDNIDRKLSFMAKCVFKTSFLTIGLFAVNVGKFHYRVENDLSPVELLLLIYLFVPNVIMALASHRFYVATSFSLFLIIESNASIKAIEEGCRGITKMRRISIYARNLSRIVADSLRTSARNHAELHQLFIEFHMMFAKLIVLILGSYFLNSVFEVRIRFN